MEQSKLVELPEPKLAGELSLEETLSARHSVREFTDEQLTQQELSQLLWAMQGITRESGGRTAPSAGALYPLEIYVAVPTGFYHYKAHEHQLVQHVRGDRRGSIFDASLRQEAIVRAQAVIIVTAVFERTTTKYGDRAARYVNIEAGHAAQNLHLQAVSLGLGSVPIGAFDDRRLGELLSLPADHAPLYVIPVGHPAS